MTQEEYTAQNDKGFEGDEILAMKFQEIIKRLGIETVIETGTYKGATTARLSKMVSQVITIESNLDYAPEINERLKDRQNVTIRWGSSVDELGNAINESGRENILFFLDAHWKGTPLLRELEIIKNKGLKPVISIHDFKVPNHPELGFDSYNRQDYEWEWIKASIEAIYGNHYKIEYNSEAIGAKRGCIFIYPC